MSNRPTAQGVQDQYIEILRRRIDSEETDALHGPQNLTDVDSIKESRANLGVIYSQAADVKKDFGAIGNGFAVTPPADDTTAFQAAFDASAVDGEHHGIYLPPGKYGLTPGTLMAFTSSVGSFLRGSGEIGRAHV